MLRTLFFGSCLLLLASRPARAEDGSELWLRYRQTSNPALLAEYRRALSSVAMSDATPTLKAARDELLLGLRGLLGRDVPLAPAAVSDGILVVGTPASSPLIKALGLERELRAVGPEGFLIRATKVQGKQATVIAANSDVGVLYGVYQLLRELQTARPIKTLAITSSPKIQIRMLDHWDNLDRSVERGYAGKSLWEWDKLPATLSPRYRDYARANASIGINGAAITNVNANAKFLTPSISRRLPPWPACCGRMAFASISPRASAHPSRSAA